MIKYKNYILLILGAMYFGLYYMFPNNDFFEFFIKNNFPASYIIFAYFNAIFAFLVVVSLISVVYFFVRRVLLKLFQRTETKFDDIALQILDSLITPIKYV
jgi:hypothetical protein